MRCPSCHREYPAGERTCPKDGATLLEALSAVLARGPLPLSQAAKVSERILLALEPLHAAAKAHARLSLNAVFMHQLGGALTLDVAEPGECPPPPRGMTAPELDGGRPATPASDLYAVGALFYTVIAGRAPFAEDAADRGKKDPPSLLALTIQDVPVELDALVRSLMATDPKARPISNALARDRIANLELDSTVMGERIHALAAAARELGSAVPEGEASEEIGEATTLPPSGPRIPAFGEGFDPVDPFADTWVRKTPDEAAQIIADAKAAARDATRRDLPPTLRDVPRPDASLEADTTVDGSEAPEATARGGYKTLAEPRRATARLLWIGGFGMMLLAAGVLYWFTR